METILFAEDEDMLRKLISRALREQGYQVIESSDGTEAVRAASGYDGRIDLLLTDIMMPGLNGSELAKRVKADRPDVQVLYISGYLREAELEPGSNFLGKPFTPAELLGKVRTVLGAETAA